MKLDMVGIITKDVAKAVEFYQHLGFEVQGESSDDYLELNNAGVRISLNSKKMNEGIYGFEPKAAGDKLELAFLCDSTSEVDETCEKMSKLGYEIFQQPWDAFWGQRYAIIKDVDENLLSLFAPL